MKCYNDLKAEICTYVYFEKFHHTNKIKDVNDNALKYSFTLDT